MCGFFIYVWNGSVQYVIGCRFHLSRYVFFFLYPPPLPSSLHQEITRGDLRSLKPGEWLNDEVINFYIGLVNERAKERSMQLGSPRIFCYGTFFYTKLADKKGYDYNKIKRWSKRAKVKITDMKKVIIPCHVNTNHWTCAVIDFGEKVSAPASLHPTLFFF